MATTTANGTGDTYPSTGRGVSEAEAIDNQFGWPTTPAACTPYLPSTLPFAHLEIVSLDGAVTTLRKALGERDAIIGRKVAYLTQLELAHADDHKRIESITLTIRELEALILRRDQEIAEKRVSLMYWTNTASDAESRAESLQKCVEVLKDERDQNAARADGLEILNDAAMNRIAAHEADMKGTLERVADLELSLKIMSEMASEAAKDADKHLNIGAELSDLLNDSGKREDRMHETLMGIRALAESSSLTDHEKVSLILRLA